MADKRQNTKNNGEQIEEESAEETIEELEEESWPRDFEEISVCCQTGCPDCPFGFNEQFDPDIPIELQLWKKKD